MNVAALSESDLALIDPRFRDTILHRKQILALLQPGPMRLEEIAEVMPCHLDTIRNHLTFLYQQGFIKRQFHQKPTDKKVYTYYGFPKPEEVAVTASELAEGSTAHEDAGV